MNDRLFFPTVIMHPPPLPPRLDALTGIRFFAALAVVFIHISGSYGVPEIEYPLGNGVTLFFVLSGFILTYVYKSVEGTERLRVFYIARFARIWPLHIATFIAAVILAVSLPLPAWAPTWAVTVLNLLLLQSWVPVVSVAHSFNAVSWSLSNEAFFYLAFPLLRRNLARSWHWKLLLSLLCGFVLIWATILLDMPLVGGHTQVTVETLGLANPLSRLFQFVLGMCCCLAWMRFGHLLPTRFWLASALELGVIGFGWWLGYHYKEMRGFDLLFGERVQLWMNHINGLLPAAAALIFVQASGHGIVGRLLAWRPVVLLGEISYAIYMSHYMLHIVIMRDFDSLSSWPWWAALVFYLGLTLGISTLLFLFVERPLRNFITGRRHATS